MRTKKLLAALLALVMLGTVLLSACGEKECKHKETSLQNVKAATCSTAGYTGDNVCVACGFVVSAGTATAIEAGAHSFDEGKITKEATCVETGIKTTTCVLCHITQTEVIPLSEVCNNEYHFESDSNHAIVCKVCHKHSSGDHTQGALVKEVAATCTEGAYTIYTCTSCASDYKAYDTTKPALGHKWDVDHPVYVASTCTTTGESYIRCLNDGCEEKNAHIEVPVNVAGHDYEVQSTIPATCTATGTEIRVCKLCNAKDFKTLPKALHNYGAATQNGSLVEQTCNDCGHKLTTLNASNSTNASIDPSTISEGNALKVALSNAALEFPSELLSTMSGQITFGAAPADKDAALNNDMIDAEDKAILENAKSKVLDFTLGGASTTFGESLVTVTVDYTLSEGEDPEGIVIWYLSDSEGLVAVEDVNFVDEDGDGVGQVIFEVSHFSFWAVAYKETPEMKCRRGVHSYGEGTTVAPDCESYGFTWKLCKVCGFMDVTSYTSPVGHSFGAKQQPVVTCDRGGYVYQECSKCYKHLNYEYIPAKGHTPVGHATCDSSVSCSVCKQVIVSAYGHNWTAWETISEPTEETSGLLRRNCPRCGKIDTITTSQQGALTVWEYNTPSELIEVLIEDMIAMDKGTVSFVSTDSSTIGKETRTSEYKMDLTLDRSAESSKVHIKISQKDANDDEAYIAECYYIDGKFYTIDGDYANMGDLDQMLTLPFDGLLKEAQLYIYSIDEVFDSGYTSARQIADILVSAYGAEINAALAENGSSLTAETLLETLDALRGFYAYTVTKMGLHTSIELPADFSMDSLYDLLGKFMTKTEADGVTTFTYDLSEYTAAYDTLFAKIEEKYDATCASVFFDTFGDVIKKTYPDVTNWDQFVAKIKTEFAGTVKVQKLVDQLTSVITEGDKYTADQVYTQLETFLETLGQKVDIEEQINLFANKTIDSLVAEIFNPGGAPAGEGVIANAADLYKAIDEYMKKTKFGDVVVGYESYYEYDDMTGESTSTRTPVTLRDAIAEGKADMATTTLTGSTSVQLNAENQFLGANANVTIKETNTNEENETRTDTVTTVMNAKADASATVTVPDAIAAYMAADIKFTSNADGSLTVSGIPEGFDAELGFQGSFNAKLDDFVTLDANMSASLGMDIYVLDQKLWDSESVSEGTHAIGPDGKIYRLTSLSDINRLEAKTPLASFQANPNSYLPAAGAETNYVLKNYSETFSAPAHLTPLGYVYQESGVWYLVDEQNTYLSTGMDSDGTFILYFSDEMISYPYSQVVSNMKISNISTDYTSAYDPATKKHISMDRLYITHSEDEEAFNLRAWITVEDGTIYLLTVNDDYYRSYYTVYGEATADYDFYRTVDYYGEENFRVVDNSYAVLSGYERVELYKKVPTYFAKYDGNYFEVSGSSMPFVKPDVSGLSTQTLPDGRTIYVVREDGDRSTIGQLYGYFQVKDSYYVPARVSFANGEVESILYGEYSGYYFNNASPYLDVYDSDVLDAILGQYIQKNADGTITVSAEGIALAQSLCAIEHDTLYLALNAEKTVGEQTVEITAYHSVAYKAATVSPDLFGSSESISWNGIFGYNDTPGGSVNYNDFTIHKQSDGSIYISGASDISLGFKDNILSALKGKVDYNETNQTYTVKLPEKNYELFAYYGGAYYDFDEYTDLIRTTFVTEYKELSLENYFKQNVRFGDIDYKYDTPEGERIYQANMYISDYYLGHRVYLKIVNGSFMILTGVSLDTNSLLKYEGQTTLRDYIASWEISYETDRKYDSISCYLADSNLPVYSKTVWISCDDFTNYADLYYYVKNGKITFIQVTDSYTEYQFDKSFTANRVTLPEGWVETDRYVETFGDIALELVHGYFYETKTNTYVELNDYFVNSSTYQNYQHTEESFFFNLCEREWVYGIEVGGVWSYYASVEPNDDDTFTLSDPIDVDTDYLVQETSVGETVDGVEIFEFSRYLTDDLKTITLKDGSTVYYNDNVDDTAYLSLGNGIYYPGSIEDGENFLPYGGTLMRDSICQAIGLSEVVDGNTVYPGILDLIAEYEEYIHCVYLESYGWNGYYDNLYLTEISLDVFRTFFE